MKIKLILSGLALAVLSFACSAPAVKDDSAATSGDSLSTHSEYTCPMHPSVVSDRPGTCPECKMELQVKS